MSDRHEGVNDTFRSQHAAPLSSLRQGFGGQASDLWVARDSSLDSSLGPRPGGKRKSKKELHRGVDSLAKIFLYSDQLDEDFHVGSITEMCRVASEARVFPLLDLSAKPSRHLKPVKERLEKLEYEVRVERVRYGATTRCCGSRGPSFEYDSQSRGTTDLNRRDSIPLTSSFPLLPRCFLVGIWVRFRVGVGESLSFR